MGAAPGESSAACVASPVAAHAGDAIGGAAPGHSPQAVCCAHAMAALRPIGIDNAVAMAAGVPSANVTTAVIAAIRIIIN